MIYKISENVLANLDFVTKITVLHGGENSFILRFNLTDGSTVDSNDMTKEDVEKFYLNAKITR